MYNVLMTVVGLLGDIMYLYLPIPVLVQAVLVLVGLLVRVRVLRALCPSLVDVSLL